MDAYSTEAVIRSLKEENEALRSAYTKLKKDQNRRAMDYEQVMSVLDRVRMQFKSPPVESMAMAFARAIERAHGIE